MVDKMIEGGQEEVLDEMVASVPAKRLGQPGELTTAVLCRCSEGASFLYRIDSRIYGMV